MSQTTTQIDTSSRTLETEKKVTMKEPAKKRGKSGKEGKKKKKGRKNKGEVMVTNSRGELVTAREFTLEQTIETNETLQGTCSQQEQDALEVIAALQRESERKDTQIKALLQQIEDERKQFAMEKESMVAECEKRFSDMNAILNEKDAAFKVMQNEFSVIKDFRKKRHELLKELEYHKLELADTERRHKEIVAKMEKKFFEEKIRLQKDANRRIAELATKAHKEAVANLNETTREVYKENLRMAEALKYHVQEGEELTKQNEKLLQSNRQLLEAKDLHDLIVKEKIQQSKQQLQEIKDLQAKIQSMEFSLTHVVREFERERESIGRQSFRQLEEVRRQAEKLRENLTRKTQEMRHIKRLAQHILDQRTDLEKFFMDSLDHVRQEIQKERENMRKAAQADYHKKLRAILSIKNAVPSMIAPLPRPNATASGVEKLINEPDSPSIFSGMATNPNKKVDISDISWADKERVLRLLFAKLNGYVVGAGQGNGGEGAEVSNMEGGGAATASGRASPLGRPRPPPSSTRGRDFVEEREHCENIDEVLSSVSSESGAEAASPPPIQTSLDSAIHEQGRAPTPTQITNPTTFAIAI
ncbi:hypothetical protein HK102_013861 [Quaeritorhiza haematococci]|nr:hypothetical protein HK102_013861 [Quaeritorhiza haematococci]